MQKRNQQLRMAIRVVLAVLLASGSAAQAASLLVNSNMTPAPGSYAYDRVTISPEGQPSGTLNILDGVTLTCATFYVGDGSGGTVNQAGGDVIVTGTATGYGDVNRLNLGGWGSPYQSFYNLSGGTLTATNGVAAFGSDDCGTLIISGGAANLLGLRASWRNKGALTLTSGALTLGAYGFVLDPIGQGQTNWTGFIKLGGGTMKASASWSSQLPMILTGDGGNVIFDPNGFDITLQEEVSSTGTGGLTVAATGGTGALVLSGTNTFAGATTVSSGTLRLTHPMTLATNTSVYLAGGMLDLDFIGTNQVAALYVNGTNQNSGVFGSSNSSSLTGSGFLQVVEATTPSASFTAAPRSGFAPLKVVFADTSTSSITNRHWVFGDGNTQETSAASVTNTYAYPGTYDVALTVTDDTGVSDTKTNLSMIRVGEVPKPTFQTAGAINMDRSTGYATFTIEATNGLQYRIVRNDNLLNASGWTNAVMPPDPDGWTNGRNAAITFTDSDATGSLQRFYRIESKSVDAE